MKKNKSIRVALACAAFITGAFPAFAGLPTIDAGNIAGTIGIVTQGATGIQQGIETIANGSNLNSIIGDAAGTLARFNEKYGADLEKGIKAAQDAQKRITEGVDAYNKYQSEIAARKAEYDALMETVSSYTGGASYDDGEFDEEYAADYDSGYDADYDAASVSTLETVDNGEMLARVPVDGLQAELVAGQAISNELPMVGIEDAARPAVVRGIMPAEKLQVRELQADDMLVSEKFVAEKGPAPVEAVDTDAVAAAVAVDSEKVSAITSSITNETTGRRRFGGIRASEAVKADGAVLQKANHSASGLAATNAVAGKISDVKKISAEPLMKNNAVRAVKDSAGAVATSSSAVKAQAVSARKFRSSPAVAPAQKFEMAPAMKIEKVSSSTVTYSSHMAFAAEKEDNTKGVGYDSNGTFISPLAQRCGVSISDLQDADKMKACTNKIIMENFAKNQYDAINSRKDCERMIYNTVVALLAETTQSKYEASNYDDTLDKQEELSGNSTDTRSDSAVIAMANEQTQILLNRMSLLVSAQIILDSVKQLCAAPKDVLKEVNTDGNKTDATDGGK